MKAATSIGDFSNDGFIYKCLNWYALTIDIRAVAQTSIETPTNPRVLPWGHPGRRFPMRTYTKTITNYGYHRFSSPKCSRPLDMVRTGYISQRGRTGVHLSHKSSPTYRGPSIFQKHVCGVCIEKVREEETPDLPE